MCLYRLFATVYIFYLSPHLERRPWRLQHSRLPAPGRLRPPPSLTARRHERRCWSSKRASCMCHFVLDSLCGFGVAEVYARLEAAFPMHHTHQSYAASTCCPRRTQPPSIRYGMYVTWTVAAKYPIMLAQTTRTVCQRAASKTRPKEIGRDSRKGIDRPGVFVRKNEIWPPQARISDTTRRAKRWSATSVTKAPRNPSRPPSARVTYARTRSTAVQRDTEDTVER